MKKYSILFNCTFIVLVNCQIFSQDKIVTYNQAHKFGSRDLLNQVIPINDSIYYIYSSQENQNTIIGPHHALVNTSQVLISKNDKDYTEELPEFYQDAFFDKNFVYLLGLRTDKRKGSSFNRYCVVLMKFDYDLKLILSKELKCQEFEIYSNKILSVSDDHIIVQLYDQSGIETSFVKLNSDFEVDLTIPAILETSLVKSKSSHSFIIMDVNTSKIFKGDTIFHTFNIYKYTKELILSKQKKIEYFEIAPGIPIDLRVAINDSLIVIQYKKANKDQVIVDLKFLDNDLNDISTIVDYGIDGRAFSNGIILENNFLFGLGYWRGASGDTLYSYRIDLLKNQIKEYYQTYPLFTISLYDAIPQNDKLYVAGSFDEFPRKTFVSEIDFDKNSINYLFDIEEEYLFKDFKKMVKNNAQKLFMFTNDFMYSYRAVFRYPFEIKSSLYEINFKENSILKKYEIKSATSSSKVSLEKAIFTKSKDIVLLEKYGEGFDQIGQNFNNDKHVLIKCSSHFENKDTIQKGVQNYNDNTAIFRNYFEDNNDNLLVLSNNSNPWYQSQIISKYNNETQLLWQKQLDISNIEPYLFTHDSQNNIKIMISYYDSLLLYKYSGDGDFISKTLIHTNTYYSEYKSFSRQNKSEIIGFNKNAIYRIMESGQIITKANLPFDIIFMSSKIVDDKLYFLDANQILLAYDLSNDVLVTVSKINSNFIDYERPLDITKNENEYILWTSHFIHLIDEFGKVKSSDSIGFFINFIDLNEKKLFYYENEMKLIDYSGKTIKIWDGNELFQIDSLPTLKVSIVGIDFNNEDLLIYGNLRRGSLYFGLSQDDELGASISFMSKININSFTSNFEEILYTDKITIYPNPACDWINIEAKNINFDKIFILDQIGKIIPLKIISKNEGSLKIELPQILRSGYYNIIINDGYKILSKKIIIQK